MSLILRELRRAQQAAGFSDAWEWRKLKAPDSRRAQLDSSGVLRFGQAPPEHSHVPAGDEVDGDKACHAQQYERNVSVGQE